MRKKSELKGDIKTLSGRLIEKNLTIRFLVKSLKRMDNLCIMSLDMDNPDVSHRQTVNRIHNNITKILEMEELQRHMYNNALSSMNNREGLK